MMNRLVNMKTYTLVVEAGSFSEAGRRLNLSKALVSKRVRQLEEHLGVRLLHRSTRSLSTTDSGAAYYEHCRKILEEVESAESDVASTGTELRGHLRVSSPTSFAVAYLGADLCEFQLQHPQLSIELLHNDRAVNPVAEAFDVCIQVLPVHGESIAQQSIAPARRLIVASPTYLANHGLPKQPIDLQDHQCAHNVYLEPQARWVLHGPDGPINVPLQPKMITNNIWLLRDAAIHGNCVAVLPTFFVEKDLINGNLIPILTDYSLDELWLVAYYHKLRHTPLKVRRLLQFLESKYCPEPPWETRLEEFRNRFAIG